MTTVAISDRLIEVQRARMQAWMLGEIEIVDVDDLRRDFIIRVVSERTQKVVDEYCRIPRQRVRRILTANGVVLFDADAGGFLNPLSSDRDLLTAEQRDLLDQRLHQHEHANLSPGAAIETLRQIMKEIPDANVRVEVAITAQVGAHLARRGRYLSATAS